MTKRKDELIEDEIFENPLKFLDEKDIKRIKIWARWSEKDRHARLQSLERLFYKYKEMELEGWKRWLAMYYALLDEIPE
jgi:hypothetical protein